MSDENETEVEPASPGDDVEPVTWRDVCTAAMVAESPSDGIGLLTLVYMTDGQLERRVDVEALAAQLGVQPQTAKALLARLEPDGWVRRRAELRPSGQAAVVFVTARRVEG
jgi:predicted Rossmann fold nucleotide-binding protein DprA/Smf involved in DNA uptake